MIYVIGDMHIRKEEPFFSAVESVFDYLFELCNEGDSVIQLGDFFHTYKPFPKEYSLAFSKLGKFATKQVQWYILAGNNAHEYHYQQKTFAINPLKEAWAYTITEPEILRLKNSRFLMLPWEPHDQLKEQGFDSLEARIKDFVYDRMLSGSSPTDYVLYHFEDETVFMGGINTGIDLSFIEEKWSNIKRIGGHIHLESKNYLGTPYQTRADEIGRIGRIMTIDENNNIGYIDVPEFISYREIDYTDDLPSSNFDGQKIMLNVKNAPSVSAVYEKFKGKDIFINNVSLLFKNEKGEDTGKELDANIPISELLKEFIEINKIDKSVSDYLTGLF